MGHLGKEIAIGFIISAIATAFGFFIYLEYITPYSFATTLKQVKEGGVLGAVIALAAIPNLFVFFIFLKKRQDYRARGVLIATIVTAIFTLILKFL